ncbi:MAG: histidine phosphatase family protein [Proteobacteria bacterium]|nr:histidine phosphatase family protein [Pseudomonadota bacterium]
MKSLLVLRHADAKPAGADGIDITRALSDLGKQQSAALGRRMADDDIKPDAISCSDAVRARETAEQVVEYGGWTAPIKVLHQFYNASVADLTRHITSQVREVEQLCIVAHAPGVADLVSWLTTRSDDLALVYPAGTLAVIDLDIDSWAELKPGCGALHCLLVP